MPKLGMRDIRREQIFQATASVIATKGFDRTTIREVADAAGLSTGTVNHYFSNKLDLLVTTVSYVSESFRERIVEAVEAEPVGLRRLEAYARVTLDGIDGEATGWKVWIAAWNEASRSQEVRDIIQRRREELYEVLRDILRGIHPDAGGDGTELADVAREIEAFVSGLGLIMVTGESGLTVDEGVEAAVEFGTTRLHRLADAADAAPVSARTS